MTITFNTADGKSFRFEDKDVRSAYHQYLNQKRNLIYMSGESEIYIVKRHITSVVVSDWSDDEV